MKTRKNKFEFLVITDFPKGRRYVCEGYEIYEPLNGSIFWSIYFGKECLNSRPYFEEAIEVCARHKEANAL